MDREIALRILRAPLYFALGLCVGVSIYFTLPFEPSLVLVSGLSGFILVLWFALRRYNLPHTVNVSLLFLAGAACGVFLAKCQTAAAARPVLTRTIGPAMVEGWVTSIEPGRNGARLRLDVHAIGGEANTDVPRRIRLTHSLSLNVAPGRFVRCWAVIRPPPQPELPGDYSFNRQAYVEHLDGVGYVQGRCQGGTLSAERGGIAGLSSKIAQFRRRLALHVREAAGDRAGGLAAALTSGDRSFMAAEDTDALRQSGLAHLLAISGLHLGLVSGLIYFFVRRGLALWEWLALRFAIQKIAAASAILGAGTYLIISGASISTQRAFIMAAVFFGAIILDKSPLSVRSFSIAMIAVIFINPHSVMSPGFQMSFAATGGLIAGFEAWSKRRQARGEFGGGFSFAMKSLILSSFIGAAATAPFALYHFDRLAPLGLAANVLAMPIITFVSAPVAGLALLTWPLGLSDFFLSLFGWSLERVLSIAEWAAEAGGEGFSLGTAMPPPVFVILIAGLIVCCLAPSLLRSASVVAMTVCAAWAINALSPQMVLHASSSGDVYVTDSKREVKLVALSKGEGLAPLRFSDVEASMNCASTICRLDTIAGPAVIGPGAELTGNCQQIAGARVVVIAPSSETSGDCLESAPDAGTYLRISDAPVTVYRTVTGRVTAKQPACGQRPWAPCLDRD